MLAVRAARATRGVAAPGVDALEDSALDVVRSAVRSGSPDPDPAKLNCSRSVPRFFFSAGGYPHSLNVFWRSVINATRPYNIAQRVQRGVIPNRRIGLIAYLRCVREKP